MKTATLPLSIPGRCAAVLALLGAALYPAGRAAGPVGLPPSPEPRVGAARVVAGGVLASEGAGRPYRRLLPKDEVHSRDLVVCVPGLRAELEPRPGSVRLTLWGNLPELSDSPVLESAVVLHDSRSYDLDLTPVRGRVVLTNRKEK